MVINFWLLYFLFYNRVMEVSDVFGFNMTYEVARNQDRGISFFKCSLSECHLNGECIVQVLKV